MDNFSFLSNTSIDWIEEQYEKYRKNADSIGSDWAHFFEGFEFARKNYDTETEVPENVQKEFKVLNLIEDYRSRGHLFTDTNPVRDRRKYEPTLAIEHYGLSEDDLNTIFQAGEEIGIGAATLKDIVAHMEKTYCESIGIEFNYIRDPERRKWFIDNIELDNRPKFNKEEKRIIFNMLNRATSFEQYLQKKFVGQKRFSIEGGEALIPSLHALIQRATRLGVKEMIIGMAHRGRLNVLGNIFKKRFKEIFSEFEGKEYEEYDDEKEFDGDVKYHLGYSNEVMTDNGQPIQLTLSPNPSHLEAVDPVVEGIARAKIDNYLKDEKAIVPVLIHGDAAIAGQGIVYEVIQMSQLDGYRTGGTIHIVINNQVGFTTNYLDARSSTYCTDVGKATLCPVFHVNGDDIEAVVQTILIAFEYRQRFGMDVFIDLLCYRKYGHNEGDEPKFTQPKLYDLIAKHPNPREIYLKQILEEGIITKEEADEIITRFTSTLDKSYDASKEMETLEVMQFLKDTWKDFPPAKPEAFEKSPETGYSQNALVALAKKFNTLPEDKKFFRKLKKLMNDRLKMIEDDGLDWAMGELLAYATLLEEGYDVRISGQDCERGTFSHRHAVLKTEDAEEEYTPLNHLSDKQGDFYIFNSLLSEYAVLGFDYGYAFASPKSLTIWEAQFGDFFNGAQILIDQFLSSAEDKWRTQNGLVMLLPHGYEGMGSEHSSGRMERFLQLCAENNMQVCNATTPANYFHLLRRQMHRDFRKPLIVFTPKKLLRYPKAKSQMAQLASGSFQEVIDDPSVNAKEVDTVVFCSGKIYYEILEQKEKTDSGENIAVVRLEQIYPLPEKQMDAVIEKYSNAERHIWLQEEPKNMGAWSFVALNYDTVKLECISRMASASPASGSPVTSAARQQAILDSLFSHAKQTVK
ncbi:MAG: 2-oxoglutarate dehydrogenase E1 component [Flavobacteriales bacterium]|nr:2-oxoglutarate dehydrogenase E1 component [Flavobacteriales bacterium]